MIKKSRYNQNILHMLGNTKEKIENLFSNMILHIISKLLEYVSSKVCLKTGLVWANVCHL